MIKEYGGKEKYTSKSAMAKHEKKEGKAYEAKERKMMMNVKMKIMDKIISLRFDLDNYKNDRDWNMVRKIRMEIAKLENMLSETY